MQTELPKADPPKRKRRWFQFSLRSLMIVVTVVACLVAMGEVFKGRIGAAVWKVGHLQDTNHSNGLRATEGSARNGITG
jgi:hypothetical protein